MKSYLLNSVFPYILFFFCMRENKRLQTIARCFKNATFDLELETWNFQIMWTTLEAWRGANFF